MSRVDRYGLERPNAALERKPTLQPTRSSRTVGGSLASPTGMPGSPAAQALSQPGLSSVLAVGEGPAPHAWMASNT